MGEVSAEDRERSFKEQGVGYQSMVARALFEDESFAEQMAEVMKHEYFTYSHLKEVVRRFFDYRRQYKAFPSVDVVAMQVERDEPEDLALLSMVREFVVSCRTPLNGDAAWVKQSSLEFCRRGCLISAMERMLDKIEGQKYDDLAGVLREALTKGAPKDHGHDYHESFDARARASIRCPIATPWAVLDKYLHGGWERKTLTTFIAPTGAGKSMFLVNCACAAVEQGLNVLYATLEMADFKIGLRADSYYSGVPINDVPTNKDKVQAAIGEKAKGRLFIKEWPTKMATVEGIRAHIQRLAQTKDFKPDVIVVDYADLLRPSRSYGEKRHELEGTYEELRGMAQEQNAVVITADQTNRGGLDLELVTLSAIAESYAKATVCDLIMTVSRTMEDKANGTGRLFIAKSRLGEDGKVLPFLFQPSTVRVTLLDQQQDPMLARLSMSPPEQTAQMLRDRVKQMNVKRRAKGDDGE